MVCGPLYVPVSPRRQFEKLGLTQLRQPIILYSRTDWSVNKIVLQEIGVYANHLKK
jgi:hypothetical protein